MAKTSQSPVRKQERLDAGERVHVGVDVHKRSYHLALWSERRGLVTTWVQPAAPQALRRRLGPHRPQIAQVVYEAGPTGYALVRTLREAGFAAEVIAPSRTPTAASPGAKSDRLDCRRLAVYAAKGLLAPVRVPTGEEEADRQIVRLREQLRRKTRRTKQQIRAFLLAHGLAEPPGLDHWSRRALSGLRGLRLDGSRRFCLDALLDDLEHTESLVARLTGRVTELAKSERHRAVVGRLCQVPGVGVLTAMTFRAELVAPERFRDGREVAAMMGLAPRVTQSGESRHQGRLMKSGNARLRTALVEAAWRWVSLDPQASQHYRHLMAKTGNAKKAIVAMARRLGIVLWRLSLEGSASQVAA
jgi:transposase